MTQAFRMTNMKTIGIVAVMCASAWFFRWGIAWLQRLFPQPVWRYSPDTSVTQLHRHHQLASLCVYACLFCIVGAVSSLLQVVVLGWQGWTMWMLVTYGAGMIVTAIPALLLGFWMGEVERECRQRGVAVPTAEHLRSRVMRDALGLLFWIAVAIASPWVLRALMRN